MAYKNAVANTLEGKASFNVTKTAHACSYCGLDTACSVVQCLTCRKWFCNNRASANAPSHIIHHLVKARHKEIVLHKDSQLGETVLECYSCGSKNVFMLGFVAAKSDTVIILLCRQPCASTVPRVHSLNLDTQHWQPLIENRAFLSWLVPLPSTEEIESNSDQVTMKQIDRLEDRWKSNGVEVEEVEETEEKLCPIRAYYEDAYQYQNIFGPLVKTEADYDKNLKETQYHENVSVRWDIGLNNHYVACFELSKLELGELKLAVGDELILGHDDWQSRGFIIRIPSNTNNEYGLELNSLEKAPLSVSSDFTVKYVWKSTPFDRMQRGLKQFAIKESSCSGYLYHKLLGHDIAPLNLKTKLPKIFDAPNLPKLNNSQKDAVKSCLQKPLSLIQGPPGTGKTVTSATIVYHLSKLQKGPILVCAPSNIAVEQLAKKISVTGLKVVRVAARSREHVEGEAPELSLTEQIKSLDEPELKQLSVLKSEMGELKTKDSETLKKLIKKAENKVLADAQVICTTCVGAGDYRLAHFKFRTVLLDEATQATEPACLIPLILGCKQIILVGDHEQLGPVIVNKKAAAAGLQQSLFERLILLGNSPVRLTVQYRMHPALSEFPSNMFYEGTLQNGVTAIERLRSQVDFPWPVPQSPLMFHANFGPEEISASGTSFLNRTEAATCEVMLNRFFKSGIESNQVGIITPYEGQRSYLISILQESHLLSAAAINEIEIASVDAFQGREKDYIIVSCVRSNEDQGIGFLSDPRRLNVALTRAKYGVILLGNPKVLSKDPLWYNLLMHCKATNTLVEGPLEKLIPCMIHLVKPSKSYCGPKRHQMVHNTQISLSKQSTTDHLGSRLDKIRLDNWPTLPGPS